MTMKIDLIGGWGDRPESLDQIATRMVATAAQLPVPDTARWVVNVRKGKKRWLEDVDMTSVVDVSNRIEATTERVWQGPRIAPGVNVEFAVVDDHDLPIADFTLRAGFADPGVSNHVLVELTLDGDRADTARVIKDYLAVLVRNWQPERLSAHTYRFMKDQGWVAPQISVGWDNYFSDAVELDSVVLEGSGIAVSSADGGRYITLDGTPAEPILEQALVVRKALGYS